ncbi:metal ABC transporter permease [Sulfurimonas sp.]|uniref:metal ABC transporter permease n=1 Tax=Sulfurimonas sp. TaxID=2022749 RepID=UPI0025FAC39C|nr:metal ABC transporter permease [Sulfurimonas sp.]MDD5158371.1 metal ABC transporter permease [Sulfurimonas sp.]
MSTIEILLPALGLAFLLVGIHTIFGLEIIKRGVIFTDLAVGQLSAVGIAVSATFFSGEKQVLLSLIFALTGALLITYANRNTRHVEAFIGLLYALGASAVMIVLSSGSGGDELFKQLMANDILFVSSGEVTKSALTYGAVALLYYTLYPRLSGFFKELFFFSLLSVTVTSSVQLAGVLVVFTLLIAPALVALLQKRLNPLLFGWIYGWFFISLALFLSYHYDWPTGYSIVFVGTLITLILVLFMEKKREVNN